VGRPGSAPERTPFQSPPPPLPTGITLGDHERAPAWLPLYSDTNHVIRLRHRKTGALRYAPWVSLRTRDGCVYFANLVTGVTRWLPPKTWMRGWISRLNQEPRNRNLAEIDWQEARLRVDGGAPYIYEPEHGLPQYEANSDDSPYSFPLTIAAVCALRVPPPKGGIVPPKATGG